MAQKLVGEANSLFVDEAYDEALEKFDQAIQLDGTVSDYYSKRSNCKLKLEDSLGTLWLLGLSYTHQVQCKTL